MATNALPQFPPVSHKNPAEAFDQAIREGRLSDNPRDLYFAGMFMYMGTFRDIDQFKNIETRRYLIR